MGAKMLQRPAQPSLREQYPEVYGALSGMMGTAPDQQGSVLDPNTARARAGAEIGFPIGTALQMMPFAKPAAAGAKALGPTAGRMAEGYLQRQGLMPNIVPNSSKQFNVVNRDASEIFGAGAERLRYTDPASGGSIEVLKRPDNTASVLSLEVPKSFRGKGIGESLQAKVLQDFPQMQGQVSSKAAAKTAYRLGRRPPNQPNASLDDVYKIMDENSSVNLVSPQMQRSFSPTFQYPQQAALDLAQQRAALPAEQGGLGLPVGNTAEQRAKAMEFNTDAYHATDADIIKFDNAKLGTNTRQNTGGDQEAVESAMLGHWFSDRDLTNKDPRGYMFGDVVYPVKLRKPKKINDKEFGSTSYIVKDPDNIRSRFAAFDPFRRNAAIAAAMGVAAPDLLAAQPKQQPSQNSLNSFIR